MRAVIAHAPCVQEEIKLAFPHLFRIIDTGNSISITDALINAALSMRNMVKESYIPICSSYLELGPKSKLNRFMVVFESFDHFRGLLYTQYDDEEYIEKLVSIYEYDVKSFKRYTGVIRYNHLVDDLNEFVLNQETSLYCCSIYSCIDFRPYLYSNMNNLDYGFPFHGDINRDLNRKIGVLFFQETGDIVSPAVHIGNGYMMTRAFIPDYGWWLQKPFIEFQTFKIKLDVTNLANKLIDGKCGISIFRIFPTMDNALWEVPACKIAKNEPHSDDMRLMCTGIDKNYKITTVCKSNCRVDMSWHSPLTILNSNDEFLGFTDSLRSYLIGPSLRMAILRSLHTKSQIYDRLHLDD